MSKRQVFTRDQRVVVLYQTKWEAATVVDPDVTIQIANGSTKHYVTVQPDRFWPGHYGRTGPYTFVNSRVCILSMEEGYRLASENLERGVDP